MNAVSPRPCLPAETDDARRARHLDQLRELAGLAMEVARAAAAEAQQAAPSDPVPALNFSRAARVARDAIALEARIAAGETLRAPAAERPDRTPPDPRRARFRATLHAIADRTEPDRRARAALRQDIDALLDDELRADPDADLVPAEILLAICDELGLPLDLSQLPDDMLGMPPRVPPPSCPPRSDTS